MYTILPYNKLMLMWYCPLRIILSTWLQLASFPGLREEKRAWFPLFAHVLNCSGIPPLPQIINLRLYTYDVETDTQCYMIGTLYHTGSTEYSVHYKTSCLCSLKCLPALSQAWEQGLVATRGYTPDKLESMYVS